MAKRPDTPVLAIVLANERSEQGFLRGLSLELKAISEAMRQAERNQKIELAVLPAATAREIADLFQDEYYRGRIRLFHYAGHADEDEIWLETEAGGNSGFTSLGLARFLGMQKNIELVFLNGCATQQHADFLMKAGVPVALVTERKINDKQAQLFAERFYVGLANGARITEAYEEAEAYLLGSVKDVQKEVSRSLLWRTDPAQSQQELQFPWRMFPEDLAPASLPNQGIVVFPEDFEPPPILESMINQYKREEFNNYKPVKLLGLGDSTMVFKAIHQTLHLEAALKITFGIQQGFQKAKSIFMANSIGLSKLNHPNLVKILDVDSKGDQILFLVMELVKGERLDKVDLKVSQRDKRGIDQLIRFAIQVAEGLKTAHEFTFDNGEGQEQEGIIHGNLMPRKVIFSESGIPKLIDFAFADLKRLPGIDFAVPSLEDGSKLEKLEDESLEYMPPEVRNHPEGKVIISKATDMYGAGALLFWMMTGKSPYAVGDRSLERTREILQNINPLLSDQLAALIHKAIHSDPQARYPELGEMIEDLRACLADPGEDEVASRIALAEDQNNFEGLKKQLEGMVLNGYRITQYLGASDLSMVFSAVSEEDEAKEVAIKISHRITRGFEEARAVVEKNARILRFLEHPNVVKVQYVGEIGNREHLYAIRELASGKRLDQENLAEKIPDLSKAGIRRLILSLLRICEGMHAAHTAEFLGEPGKMFFGMPHGNLSPKKIFVDESGKVKLIDFLFGELAGMPEVEMALPPELEQKRKATAEEALKYYPKEVQSGKVPPTKEADIYALGAIFYEMLTARSILQPLPASSEEMLRFLKQRNRKFPRGVGKTLFKALHPDPYSRYHTVQELLLDLLKSSSIITQLFFRVGHYRMGS